MIFLKEFHQSLTDIAFSMSGENPHDTKQVYAKDLFANTNFQTQNLKYKVKIKQTNSVIWIFYFFRNNMEAK